MSQPNQPQPAPDGQPPRNPALANGLVAASITSVVLMLSFSMLSLLFIVTLHRGVSAVTVYETYPTPPPTATPVRGTLTGPTFGGLYAAFLGAYGQPTRPDEWDSMTLAGENVSLQVSESEGLDYETHILGLQIEPATVANWDTQTAFKLTAALLPSDSHFVRNDTSLPHYLTRIYTSAALAVTWGSAPFVNDADQPTPVGEFSVGCQLNNADQVSLCFISPGAP